MAGEGTIPERKVILAEKKEALLQSIAELQKAVAFIDWKQGFYDDVLSGKTEYYSNLIPELMKFLWMKPENSSTHIIRARRFAHLRTMKKRKIGRASCRERV